MSSKTEKRSSVYEAMFLLSTAQAADFGGAITHINEILGRSQAEVIAMKKWDERRLAYEIDGNKRGVYILAYFKAPNELLGNLERDLRLSEKITRSLILRADHISAEEIQASDGRKELEVEAKLRAERAATNPETAASAPASAPAEAAQN